MIEIAFRTKALRTVCLNEEAIDKQYGPKGGAALRRVLADVAAAECLGDVPLLTFAFSDGADVEVVRIIIGGGLLMVVKSNHRRPPMKAGGIDWALVHRVLIQRIEYENG